MRKYSTQNLNFYYTIIDQSSHKLDITQVGPPRLVSVSISLKFHHASLLCKLTLFVDCDEILLDDEIF